MLRRSVSLLLVLLIALLGSVPATDVQAQDSTTAPDLTFSQDRPLRFDHLTSNDGLSTNGVRAILQDRNGFLWVGTYNGLNRFDGYSFTTFLPDEDDPTSLNGTSVNGLYEDPDGIIWVATIPGGLNRYDPTTETFTHYTYDEDDPTSLNDDGLVDLYPARDGGLWLATVSGGLNKFDPTTETFTHYTHDPDDPTSVADGIIWDVIEDQDGYVWLATASGGLNKFDPTTETFTRYTHDEDDPTSISADRVATVYEDSDGTIWAGTWATGLNKFDPATETFTRYLADLGLSEDPARSAVRAILEDRDGNFWLGVFDGAEFALMLFDRATGDTLAYAHDPTNPQSYAATMTWLLYQDREGIVWAGTEESGLVRFAATPPPFALYRHDPDNANSIPNDGVRAVYPAPDGTLWLGTQGGLSSYNSSTATHTRYLRIGDVSPANVLSITSDADGMLWIGTLHGLFRMDTATGEFEQFAADLFTEADLPWVILALYSESPDTLWFAEEDGLYRLDVPSDTVTRYQAYPDEPASADNHVGNIYPDRDGNLWLASWYGGLHRFDPQTKTFTTYRHNPDDDTTLPSDAIWGVTQTEDGTVWVGTGNGLARLDPATYTFTTFNTGDGLANSSVRCITHDHDGVLWLGTLGGLAGFDPRDNRAVTYGVEDGLQGDSFGHRACATNAQGELFFAGADGINRFHPDHLTTNVYAPPVVLTSMRLLNEPVPIDGTHLSAPIWAANTLTLQPEDSVVSFDFAALGYADPANNRYRYTLEGFEQGWNEVSSQRRIATYTNLDPGTYTFRVEGTNSDGMWSDSAVAVAVTVLPPWYETWWFRLGLALLVLGAVVGGVTWRVRSIEQRNRLLEQQVAERTRELAVAREQADAANAAKSAFLASMSHELRTPLNGILGFAQILQRRPDLANDQRAGLEVITQSGNHLLMLINDVLDLSRIEAGKLDLHPTDIDLPVLLDGIVAIVRPAAVQKNLQLQYEPDAHLPVGVRADAQRLRQVLLNLLSNAIKFTPAGSVTLRVTAEPPTDAPNAATNGTHADPVRLTFAVQDTGVGIAPDQLAAIFEPFQQVGDQQQRIGGTGLGLAITRQLVDLMGGTLTVESTEGQGSCFAFTLALPVAVPAAAPTTLDHQYITGYQGNRRHILIADDKAENRAVLQSLLEPLGFTVTTVTNGQEVVEQVQHNPPDLVLLDLVMPDKTGFEAAKEIRAMPAHAHIPIIAVSASILDTHQQGSRVNGCDAFLSKPIHVPQLLATLQEHLAVTWDYATVVTETATPDPADVKVLPPAEELEILHELALIGNMDRIQDYADRLGQSDANYEPLARLLQQLAADYADERILTLVEQWRERSST